MENSDTPPKKRTDLNGSQKRAVMVYLLERLSPKKEFPKDLMEAIRTKFQVSERVVKRIWKLYKQDDNLTPQQRLKALSPKRKGNCWRKRLVMPVDVIRNLPAGKRRNVRAAAKNS